MNHKENNTIQYTYNVLITPTVIVVSRKISFGEIRVPYVYNSYTMKHLTLHLILLIEVSCAVIISQQNYGSIATQLDHVHFQTAEWDAFFTIDIICVNKLYDRPIRTLVMETQSDLVTAFNKLAVGLNNESSSVQKHLETYKQVLKRAQSEVNRRCNSVLNLYRYITTESEFLYGIFPKSLCEAPTPSEVFIDKQDHTNTLWDVNFDGSGSLKETPKDGKGKRDVRYSEALDMVDGISKQNKDALVAIHNYHTHMPGSGSQFTTHVHAGSNNDTITIDNTRQIPLNHDPPQYKPRNDVEGFIPDLQTIRPTVIKTDKRDNQDPLSKTLADALELFNRNRYQVPRESENMILGLVDKAKEKEDCSRQCASEMHESIRRLISEIHLNAQIRDKRSLKGKRGQESDLSTWWSRLTGTTSSAETVAIQKKLNHLLNRTTVTENLVMTIQQDLSTMINIYQNSTQSKLVEAMDEIDDVRSFSRNIQLELADINKAQNEIYVITTYVTFAGTLNSLQLRALALIQEIERQLLTVRDQYEHIRDVFATKRFPYELVPFAKVGKIMDAISKAIPTQNSVVPYDNVQQLLANLPTDVMVGLRKVVFHMRIPIIFNSVFINVWHLTTIPLFSEGTWIQTHIKYNYLVKNTQSELWTSLTSEEYTQCLSNPLKICGEHHQWYSMKIATCETSLADLGGNPAELCIISTVDNKNLEHVYYSKIQRNEWLISLSDNNTAGTMTCQKISDNTVVKSDITLHQYSKVALNDTCTLDILGHRLHPDIYSYGESRYNLEGSINMTETPYKVEDISYDIPKIGIRVPRSDHQSDPSSEIHILSRGATLEQIRNRTNKNIKVYRSEIDRFRDEEKQLENIVEHKSMYDLFFGSWWRSTLSSMGIILGCGLSGFILYKCIMKRLNPAAMAAIPLAANVQGSYAMPPEPFITTVVPNVTTTISPLKIIEAITNATKQLERDMIIQSVTHLTVMITLMILCHIIYTKYMSYLHSRTRLKLNYRPLNRAITHLAGESKLIMTFLVRINCLFHTSPRYHEVLCQVCTIPGLAANWNCEVREMSGKMFSPQSSSRIRFYHSFSMRWGPLCLKSVQFPNMDSCQNLPPIIKLSSPEVLSNRQANLPWDWYSLTPYSITKLTITDDTTTKILYTFDMHDSIKNII